ncbi:hypothetical protein BS78_K308500 [Paspalum vaginatum]|uniref:Myb/SANT-like domain-containing protein n=1 Tax=Paspalum vaginatum TaxID=158149 RepID=A0A9W7X9P3_9POAL|nr:hypothetical protein BS78_K308500 [Paspalum vaginatum]
MCQLISTGVRTDKGFKELHLNQVAKAVQEFSGREISGNQVYNHLRKWRLKWIKVTKVRELSGALWDEENSMITLEEEHYNGHAHPKDAEFLNKPITYYQQMMVIFGNGQATGKYAMGSNEALGSPSDFAESSLKTDIFEEGKACAKAVEELDKMFANAPKSSDVHVGSKKKRSILTEEDSMVLTNVTDAVNNVADAIRATKVDEVHPELYGAVMYMPGFTEEALIVAFSHLVDNKAQGTAFVGMCESHRVLWLRTFLTKHYYV